MRQREVVDAVRSEARRVVGPTGADFAFDDADAERLASRGADLGKQGVAEQEEGNEGS